VLEWNHGIVLLAIHVQAEDIVRIFTSFKRGGQLDNPKVADAVVALRAGNLTYTQWCVAQRIVDSARHKCALQGRTREARELLVVLAASQRMLQ
jgi:hypothetical protein